MSMIIYVVINLFPYICMTSIRDLIGLALLTSTYFRHPFPSLLLFLYCPVNSVTTCTCSTSSLLYDIHQVFIWAYGCCSTLKLHAYAATSLCGHIHTCSYAWYINLRMLFFLLYMFRPHSIDVNVRCKIWCACSNCVPLFVNTQELI